MDQPDCETSLTLTGMPAFYAGRIQHANAVRVSLFQAQFTGPPGREPRAYTATDAPLAGIAADLCESVGRHASGLVAGQHPHQGLCLFALPDLPGGPLRLLAFLSGDTDHKALNQALGWVGELDALVEGA